MNQPPRDRKPLKGTKKERLQAATPPTPAPAHAPAHTHVRTKDEVLEDTINEVIEIALENGMTRDEVDAVLYRMVEALVDKYRSGFKFHT